MSKLTDSFYKALKLGLKMEQDQDDWEYTEEPHVSRRREILAKYPQIKRLMGYDPWIAFVVAGLFLIQLAVCWAISIYKPGFVVFILLTYIVSATINHSLGSAIHEIGHNLAFGHKRAWANRLLSLFCNLPLGVPIAISYKKYHTDHHRWLGHEENDVDIPMKVEAALFKNPFTKIIWLTLHPLIHGMRPFLKSPKPTTPWEIGNFVSQFSYDAFILYFFGVQALLYMVFGTLIGLGVHPMAGHFISEHYIFSGSHQATHSYYGPLNALLFNVGYHIEHHDFPYIPYRRLPEVRRIAPEYYNNLPHHTSLLQVLWDFIFTDQLGPHARGITSENKSKPEMYTEVQKNMEAKLRTVSRPTKSD